MYNVAKVIGITKDMILSKVTEYDIYCKYLGFKPILGTAYKSPLRTDSNPSFALFKGKSGVLMYKDFGGTSSSGDVFKFVKELNHLKNIYESILDIYSTMIKGRVLTKISNNIQVPKQHRKEISINAIPFNEEGIKYWNSYGITLDILNKFNVKQIKNVFINNELKDRYRVGNPIFSYLIYDKFKIYKPFDNNIRFYTDCDSNYIQGLKQIDFSKNTLIITKSLKDVMLLYKLGYTAIAPHGEGYDIPQKVIDYIKNNFKKIIIFYDNDHAGISNSIKLSSKYDLDYILIPDMYNAKDITDFYKEYGNEKTIDLLTNLI